MSPILICKRNVQFSCQCAVYYIFSKLAVPQTNYFNPSTQPLITGVLNYRSSNKLCQNSYKHQFSCNNITGMFNEMLHFIDYINLHTVMTFTYKASLYQWRIQGEGLDSLSDLQMAFWLADFSNKMHIAFCTLKLNSRDIQRCNNVLGYPPMICLPLLLSIFDTKHKIEEDVPRVHPFQVEFKYTVSGQGIL